MTEMTQVLLALLSALIVTLIFVYFMLKDQ